MKELIEAIELEALWMIVLEKMPWMIEFRNEFMVGFRQGRR